jgi:hypothetical protein
MEFYSATKKNEILSFSSKWMEHENITWMPALIKDIQFPVPEEEDESSFSGTQKEENTTS